MEMNSLLPIGSVVLLNGGIKKVMVTGIFQELHLADAQKEKYDYIGVIFPEGFLNVESLVLFNHEDINDIIFRGYSNSEREEFLKELSEAVVNSGDL